MRPKSKTLLQLLVATCCFVLSAVVLSAVPPIAPEQETKAAGVTRPPDLPMTKVLKLASPADFEAAYLALMIHHHVMGADLWSLARALAKDDTIRTMENKTMKRETIEIEQMTAWLKKYHGESPDDIAVPATSRAAITGKLEELKKAAPSEFDARFAQAMTAHHLEAIAMSRLAVQKAEHPEVKELARTIALVQTKDHKKLQGIAKAK